MEVGTERRITRESLRASGIALVVGLVAAVVIVAGLAIAADDGFVAGIVGGALTGLVVGVVAPRWSGFLGGLLGFGMGASTVVTVASATAPPELASESPLIAVWLGGIVLMLLLGALPFMVGWAIGMFTRRVTALLVAVVSGTARSPRASVDDVDAPEEG